MTGERDARDYLAHATGATTAAERNVIGNGRLLEEVTERDVPRLADMITPAAEDFIAAAKERPLDQAAMTATGVPMTTPMMTTALLGEQLVHGLDLARALGAPWPIGPQDALLVISGVMAMVPEYVDRQKTAGLHLAYELRFRGRSPLPVADRRWIRCRVGNGPKGRLLDQC